MKPIAALLALLAADSSWRSNSIDPTKFTLVHTAALGRPSTVSPSGTFLAVYSGTTATLVDVRRGAESHVLRGHEGNIHDSGWSRDGRFFATSGYDGVVRTWETAGGRLLAVLTPHTGYS